MKKRILISGMLLTAAIIFGGCGQESAARTQQESTGQTMKAEAPKTQKQETTEEGADVSAADAGKENVGTVSSEITEEEAKSIALKDAGVEEAQVAGIRVNQEYDDGKQKYEVDFYVENREYDYDIDVVTGEILSVDFEIENDFLDGSVPKGQQETSGAIAREEALKIVLERVEGATEQDVRMELEKDDGYWKYEGEIYYNQREYEFELNGETGEVLEWSEEGIDD